MPICPRGHESIADDFCDECGRPIDHGVHGGPGGPGAPGGHGVGPAGGTGYNGGWFSPTSTAVTEHCPVCHTPRTGDWLYCEACGHQFGTQAPVSVPMDPGEQLFRPSPPPVTREEVGPPPMRTDEHLFSEQHTVFGSGPVVVPPPPPPPPPPGPGSGLGTGPHQSSQPTYVWTLVVHADADYFGRVVGQGGPDAHMMRFPPYHEAWSVRLDGDRMRVGRRRGTPDPTAAPLEIDLSGPPSDPGISRLHAVLMRTPDGSWAVVDPGSANGTTLNGSDHAIEVNVPVDLHAGDRIHIGAWTTLEVRLVVV
ncbi:FHA domain-containing protein [Yinghuangia seranimata]|uniref:FHA domain-containing protein n=1 Tax=Yinghuangia seranimata TaxID=408067 RepID=UPI00248C96AB|nr:FHA domain-containing protein [Yinghuangia seranimata]MDI2125196.1 FHA domain-containing protein [Yinghuangia seranimata]